MIILIQTGDLVVKLMFYSIVILVAFSFFFLLFNFILRNNAVNIFVYLTVNKSCEKIEANNELILITIVSK